MRKIITPKQEKLINFLADSQIRDLIYFTGGTALSKCYLKHRLSTDIDIFSSDLIDENTLQIFIKDLKEKLKIKKIKSIRSMNRNMYMLDDLKFEIVYFPFKNIDKFSYYKNLKLDSLEDIATNKILSLYQRNDPKDVFDIFCILQNTDLSINTLIANVEKKFSEMISESLLMAKIQSNVKNIEVLEPIVFQKKSLTKARDYFTQKNKKFLARILF